MSTIKNHEKKLKASNGHISVKQNYLYARIRMITNTECPDVCSRELILLQMLSDDNYMVGWQL